MAKVSLVTIANLDNPSTATSQINLNFARIGAQVDLLLSRDGESPNPMLANLDMNGFRITNLPAPASATEPARHGDIQQYVDQAEAAADRAETEADRAESEADEAEASANSAAASLETFWGQYGGSAAVDPSVDLNGDPLSPGFFYFNTTVNAWRFWYENRVLVGTDTVIAGADAVRIDAFYQYPAVSLSTLADVDGQAIADGDVLVWNAGQDKWLPVALSAENVTFDDTTTDLNGATLQAAIEDLVNRTSLAVYDVSFWAGGLMENGETVFRMVMSRETTLPVGATGSIFNARVAANAETVISLQRNGVQFGTITVAAAGTSGTFSVAAEETFNIGDIFTVVAPNPADTTLRDSAFVIAMRR